MDPAREQEIARCLFRESNDAFFIFDPDDHRVVDVNPAALRLTGERSTSSSARSSLRSPPRGLSHDRSRLWRFRVRAGHG